MASVSNAIARNAPAGDRDTESRVPSRAAPSWPPTWLAPVVEPEPPPEPDPLPAEPLPNLPPGNLREPPAEWAALAAKRWGGADPKLPNIVVDSSPTRAELEAIFRAMHLEPLEGEPGVWIDPTDPMARLI
jgi:hypothetical protein